MNAIRIRIDLKVSIRICSRQKLIWISNTASHLLIHEVALLRILVLGCAVRQTIPKNETLPVPNVKKTRLSQMRSIN